MSTPETTEPATLKDRLMLFFKTQIDGGYKLQDRDSATRLKKLAMQELKIKQGNQAHVNDALKMTMEKLNLKFPESSLGKSLGQMKVKLIKTETLAPTPSGAAAPTGQAVPSGSGSPMPQNQSMEPIAPENRVTAEMAQSYESGMKHLFGGLMKFYAKIGAIEAEDVPHDDKPMKLADYIKETDALAHDWSDYCLRNNIKLPRIFELAMLVVTTVMVLGSPLFSMMFFGRKKSKKVEKGDLGRDGDNKENAIN